MLLLSKSPFPGYPAENHVPTPPYCGLRVHVREECRAEASDVWDHEIDDFLRQSQPAPPIRVERKERTRQQKGGIRKLSVTVNSNSV